MKAVPLTAHPDWASSSIFVFPSILQAFTGPFFVLMLPFQAQDGLQQSQYPVVVPDPLMPPGMISI